MPSNSTSWPTLDSMIQQNQRLVVFTSKSTKEAFEGITYRWRYVAESIRNRRDEKRFLPEPCRVSSYEQQNKINGLVESLPDNPDFIEACFANAPTGCNTIDSWKMKFGDCDPRDAIPASAPTSSSAPASTSASTTAKRGDGYKESFANSDGQQIQFEWLMGTDLLFGACLSVGGRDHDCCKRRKGGDSARWRGLELMVLLGDEYVCNMRKEAW